MKRIDEYVSSVYAHVDGNEAKELKEEMRVHLLEAVEELKEEGKSEEEAVSIALERFGDEQLLRRKVVEHFRVPRVFSVNLLRTAIIFAVLGILIGCIFAYNEYRLLYQRESVEEFTLSVLNADREISEGDKEIIVEYVEKAPQVKNLYIYPENSDSYFKEAFEYQNPKPFKHIMYLNGMAGKAYSNGSWIVNINFEHFHLAWINAIVICFVVYWVLFAIWAMIQAYRHCKLHPLWMVAFSLFNVPAYFVYRASLR
ncbi:hypothetical protein FE783_36810 [Paenibacillus mesophilus]|uniref:permease prefix domain 1-containing protein n=1 Tax=Paenibacillus mesophilus TaxID=2582849 RepID=UPI00110DDE25|nr:permease prefix domain 1-containing protein [Paenibacillus mesophilus]TMV42900.1 hypothetical protein FE783_36810 [Paenibacillus mesophilus]